MIHAYVYGRWTNQYVAALNNWVLPNLNARQRDDWVNHYHGKVLTPELAAELITLDHDIDARNQEHIMPYPMARAMANLNTILGSVPFYVLRCRPEKVIIPLVRSVL